MTEGEQIILDNLGPGILRAAKEGRMADMLSMLVESHLHLLCRPRGLQFVIAALLVIRRGRHGDAYVPFGCIPDVVKGGMRKLANGCYAFGEILDLAAHQIVSKGEAAAVEAQLRAGATVRTQLRERYGVVTGESERGDKSDLKRFQLWLADAKWRIRKMKADQKCRVKA